MTRLPHGRAEWVVEYVSQAYGLRRLEHWREEDKAMEIDENREFTVGELAEAIGIGRQCMGRILRGVGIQTRGRRIKLWELIQRADQLIEATEAAKPDCNTQFDVVWVKTLTHDGGV